MLVLTMTPDLVQGSWLDSRMLSTPLVPWAGHCPNKDSSGDDMNDDL
jgi:hypothetical protein